MSLSVRPDDYDDGNEGDKYHENDTNDTNDDTEDKYDDNGENNTGRSDGNDGGNESDETGENGEFGDENSNSFRDHGVGDVGGEKNKTDEGTRLGMILDIAHTCCEHGTCDGVHAEPLGRASEVYVCAAARARIRE